MAEFTPLPTNYVDDILASSNTRRKYQQTDNSDGTKSFTDVTVYSQEGTNFGADDINNTNRAINGIYSNRILTLDELELVTEPGFFVDAQALAELSVTESAELRNNYNKLFGYAERRGKQVSITSIFSANQWTYESAGWIPIGTLPTSMRPPRQQNGVAVYGSSQDTVTGIRVTTEGSVQVYFRSGSGQYLNFSMSYLIA